MMITINPRTKTVYKTNLGYTWTEEIPLKGFEVSGGKFFSGKYHLTMKSAIKEKEIRESMIKKFPFLA